jgi:hypothetical protein
VVIDATGMAGAEAVAAVEQRLTQIGAEGLRAIPLAAMP